MIIVYFGLLVLCWIQVYQSQDLMHLIRLYI